MTRVRYKEKGRYRKIEIKGHTGAGKKGQDIVCAGVSTLLITLIAAMDSNEIKYSSDIKDGYGRVSSLDEGAKEAFNTVMCGLNALALMYPDNLVISGQ